MTTNDTVLRPVQGGAWAEPGPPLEPDEPEVCETPHNPGDDRSQCLPCVTRRKWINKEAVRRLAADGDDGSGWAPATLTDAEPVPDPRLMQVRGGRSLLRLGDVVNIHGVPASGKSPLSYLTAVQEVQRGNLALIVDYEMGQQRAAALLRELGLTDDQIDEGVYFVHSPPLLIPEGRARLVAEVETRIEVTGRVLTVGVIDSLTKSMTRLPHVSDNDAQDVANWYGDMPQWLRDQFGATMLVIDHSGVNDGARPSGSHKKREEADHHLWVRKEAPFSRKRPAAGRSSLVVVKDRSGDTEEGDVVAVLRTDEGTFRLDLPAAPKQGEVEIPLDLQPSTDEELLADLKEAGDGGVLRTMLCGQGSRGTHRRKALDRLLSDGRAVERPDPDTPRGRRLWAAEHAS